MADVNNAPVPQSDAAMDTSTTPATPLMSGIRIVPDAPPVEAVTHTGNAGNFETQYMHSQWIQVPNIPTWSTGQLPGTILWQSPIHPMINRCTDFMSQVYSAWSGGFDFKIKVVGTAFHGGWLAFTRVPPHVPLSSLKRVDDFTMFETVYLDPKATDCADIQVMDQRPILYHLNTIPLREPQDGETTRDQFLDSLSFGGRLVMWVSGQLLTSSTGSQTIHVLIWTKPGAQFTFAQVIPPGVTDIGGNEDVYARIADAVVGYQPLANWANIGEELVSIPAEFYDRAIALSTDCVDLNGDVINDINGDHFPDFYRKYFSTLKVPIKVASVPLNSQMLLYDLPGKIATDAIAFPPWGAADGVWPLIDPNDYVLAEAFPLPHFILASHNNYTRGVNSSNSQEMVKTKTFATTAPYSATPCPHYSLQVTGGFSSDTFKTGEYPKDFMYGQASNVSFNAEFAASRDYCAAISLDLSQWSPPNGESYVLFYTGDSVFDDIACAQTYAFKKLCASGVLSRFFSRTSTLVFSLNDKVSGAPAMYIRLLSTGLFTTNASKNFIHINANTVTLQYVGTYRINDGLPSIPVGDRLAALINTAVVRPSKEGVTSGIDTVISALRTL
ncbi:hypothetical protein 2 [Hubei picorna-like virus 73]|uniref:hypothetical protein 2 n=1 Tax=Hubei picorna-like virus 73 TaxID=1923157 RepID=UPI00090990DC|nr:hypothetical protein 2 [Hubei picorna-like virus 73]APG77514.1 hypothetical protein 2 [Hubei picorna-like virus 73]